jgi:hypothetical protein
MRVGDLRKMILDYPRFDCQNSFLAQVFLGNFEMELTFCDELSKVYY